MKMHFDEMTKAEQWIICSLGLETTSEILKNKEGEGLDIVFTINGVEIPFSQVMKRINDSFDHNLAEEVRRITGIHNRFERNVGILQEKIAEINEIIENIDNRDYESRYDE